MSEQHPPGEPGPTGGRPEEHSYGRSYGAPPPGAGPRPKPTPNAPLAVAGLVAGIIGVVPCFWGIGIVAVAAVVLGLRGRRQVQESGGALRGDNLAVAAIVLGVLGLLATVIYWVLILTNVLDPRFNVGG